ncbi:MAG: FlgD immunoglobulin-like domain containing protein [Bacteroidota bacterium]
MTASDSFPPHDRTTFRNWTRSLTIALFLAIPADVRAQSSIVWHSFSVGFQKGTGGQVCMGAIVGQAFSGIQGSGSLVVTSGFAAFQGVQNVVSDVHGEGDLIPANFNLLQNFPNPFNPSTVIRYDLPRASRLAIKIYSLLGQTIVTLLDDVVEPGRHSVTWTGRSDDGRPVPTGVYFYRIEALTADNSAPSFVQVRKMLLLK